jgi:hypothetical protein
VAADFRTVELIANEAIGGSDKDLFTPRSALWGPPAVLDFFK